MIATAYDLPYEVLVGRLQGLDTGGAFQVSLVPRVPMSAAAATDFASLFTAFDVLAQTGALGGPDIAPWDSGIETANALQNGGLQWQLTGCRVDKRAVVILAQAFLLSPWRSEIGRIEIGEPPFAPLARLPEDGNPYPTRWRGSTIPIVKSAGLSDSVRFISGLRRPMRRNEARMLSNLLFNCATSIGMGLFGVAPLEPKDCGLLFSDELDEIGDEVILSLDKFRAHASALDAFLNVYIAFDHGREIVDRIEVE